MRHRCAALLLSFALTTTVAALLASPARAEVDGVTVTMTEVPGELEPGEDAETVEAVVSTVNEGRCRKVRWSMVLTVDGIGLDEVNVERIEDNGRFPLRVRADGDSARLTDARPDPGELCRGRTVTARYRVSVDEDAPAGRISFTAQAFDTRRGAQLLAQASADSRVDGERESPSPSPSPSPTLDEPEEESEEAVIPPPADDSGVALDPAAAGQKGTPTLLGPGLIVGAALVFAGVGLLLRIRLRNRKQQRPMRYQHPGYMQM